MTTYFLFSLFTLLFLVVLSALFSSTETAMMAINRYRLKHKAKTSKSARRVHTLLKRPDRLLGVILLGNTFVNIYFSAIGTMVAVDLFGEKWGLLIAPITLTLTLLIFGETAPKTLAALYPEKVAFPVSALLVALLKILYPLVWVINSLANGILKCCGVSCVPADNHGISQEELRTVVLEATNRITSQHRLMLLSILDLEKIAVEDLMIPRNEVIGIDLNKDWSAIMTQLESTQHTFLPVYRQDLNELLGIIHSKRILHLMAEGMLNEASLEQALTPALFIPQGTTLIKQLLNFQKNKERVALVVDEYGDLLGLITLEDILEEIVGEFTTNMSESYTSIHLQQDGSYLVDGATTVRECNRAIEWSLPVTEAKTINGMVIEYLQTIPEIGTCCLIENIPIEVVQVQDNRIKTVKIFPPIPIAPKIT